MYSSYSIQFRNIKRIEYLKEYLEVQSDNIKSTIQEKGYFVSISRGNDTRINMSLWRFFVLVLPIDTGFCNVVYNWYLFLIPVSMSRYYARFCRKIEIVKKSLISITGWNCRMYPERKKESFSCSALYHAFRRWHPQIILQYQL